MSKQTKLPGILAGLLLTFGVAMMFGCGGGDSTSAETSASSPPLTKKEFVIRANATCIKHFEEKDAAIQQALSKQGGTPSTKELEKLAVEVVLPAYKSLIDELAQLSPPSSDVSTIDNIIRKYRADLKQAEGNPQQIITSEPFNDANEAAHEYGLETCSL